MLRSIITIVFFWTVVPHLITKTLKLPLLAGFASSIAGQTILLFTLASGIASYLFLCVSLIFDGFGAGILAMLAESLVAFHIKFP
jgi:hypothetical protein